MASETFVSAMMLITAVVASAILITAVFPIVWTMVSTFASASHDTDTRMRTDFKIVTTFAPKTGDPSIAKIWLKNIGTNRIGLSELKQSDVFIGPEGTFTRVDFDQNHPAPADPVLGHWNYYLFEDSSNGFWDIGETIEVHAYSNSAFTSGQYVYFQFVLPNGVMRSTEFTASTV